MPKIFTILNQEEAPLPDKAKQVEDDLDTILAMLRD